MLMMRGKMCDGAEKWCKGSRKKYFVTFTLPNELIFKSQEVCLY